MRTAVIPFSLVAAFAGSSTASLAADLEKPYYRDRDVVVERPAPPVVLERERIIEWRYYSPQEEMYVAPGTRTRPSTFPASMRWRSSLSRLPSREITAGFG